METRSFRTQRERIVDLVNELQERHVHFKSLTDGIDTKTPAGRFFFHVMASLAQVERELIIERTRAGLEAAKRRGRGYGTYIVDGLVRRVGRKVKMNSAG